MRPNSALKKAPHHGLVSHSKEPAQMAEALEEQRLVE